MSVLYTVKEDSATLWCICRDHTTYLATRLGMNEAIRQAGQLARDHHRRSGLTVAVEIQSREGTTLLSRYSKPQPPVAEGSVETQSEALPEPAVAAVMRESAAA